MVLRFNSAPPRPRSASIVDALKQANEHLDSARETNNQKEKHQLCKDAKLKLKDAEKIFTTTRVGHALQDEGIAKTYHKHAAVLFDLEFRDKANKSHKKAEDWGFVHAASQQNCPIRRQSNVTAFIRRSFRLSAAFLAAPGVVTATHQDASNLDNAEPVVPGHTQEVTHAVTDHIPEENVNNTAIPQATFRQDVVLSPPKYALPEDIRRITSTPQLAYCLSLSLPSLESKEGTNETDHELSQAKGINPEEQQQLHTMATDLIREFIRDELKTPVVVAEALCLAVVLDTVVFRKLLQAFVDGIEKSVLLESHLLDGLAHLIGNAAPGRVDADDLVQILELLYRRLKGTHKPSTQHIYRLMQTVSRVLDSMVVGQVKNLKREQLHEPLSAYLKKLQEDFNPYLAYQASYAYQALQHIPDDETVLRAALRYTGKIVQGASGVACAVKALDLNGLIQGLQSIQAGLSGARNAIAPTKDAVENASALAENGITLVASLAESMSLGCKKAWYPALRGLDLLLQDGRFVDFEKLIREAPCRRDPAFQIGVCLRLGDVAANLLWDYDIRQCAISFLGEIYRDDANWGHQADVKKWILSILTHLSQSPDDMVSGCVEKLFDELKVDRSILQVHAKEYPGSCPVMTNLQFQTSSLLDRVLNKPDVEAALRQLRKDRLNERSKDIYISPRARANKASKDDFEMSTKVQEFLSSKKKVLLLLGDSGAGKSTFMRALETSLWEKYEKYGRIPLFIHLSSIEAPEQDLIKKQLHKANFTAIQIRELKTRDFILICDGYDESQQIRNLYMSNQLNQFGGWQAQMVISCRTEYTGVDYKDHFQPISLNTGRDLGLMQEMIVEPFNKDQIQGYVDQYVSLTKASWKSEDYIWTLKQIPNLLDLVRNPFLLKMALDVLPTIANTTSNLSIIRITRVTLYDMFVKQWLERSKKRFTEVDLGYKDMENFKVLSSSGFVERCTTYLKELATAVYGNQSGYPTIKYSEYYDRKTWKEAFFSNMNGNNLLREAIPLVRHSDQYRFIHKSVLEYGLTLAVCDPNEPVEYTSSLHVPSRRGSVSSIRSFETIEADKGTATPVGQPLLESPLGKRSLVKERSILQFLAERAQQQPAFKDQLYAIILLSKKDKNARTAAANSITVLVQAGVQFNGVDLRGIQLNGADLRGIQIPGADLSYGMFDSARLDGADLRKTILRGVWFRQANLNGALMRGVQFGELPYLQEDAIVSACAYSPNGETFAAGLENGDISLYDTATWSKVQTLKGHGSEVSSLAYSVRGDQIASGSNDMTVRLWDVETGDCTHTLQGHSQGVTGVRYSPKGDRVASGSADSTIRLWDVESGNCIHTLQGQSQGVMSVGYSPKGDRIASGSADSTIWLWDVETGHCVHTLQGHRMRVTSVVYSPQGGQIASGSDDKTVRLWNVETDNCVHTLEGHSNFVRSVAYSPKGDQIASGSEDKTIRLWDVETGNCIHTLEGHSLDVTSVMYSPKGDQIASGSDDKTVRLWDVETGDYDHTSHGHTDFVRSVAYSPEGDQVASASDDKTIRLWDVETGKCIHTFEGHSDYVLCVVYSPKGDQIASGSMDTTVRVWDVESSNCVHTFQGHDGRATSVAYSPNGAQIACGSSDSIVRLWDVETANCVHTLLGHSEWVESVMYSPKGDQLASGAGDKTIRLWDVVTGNCVHTLRGHSSGLRSVVYSPKGDQIASSCKDGIIRLWDIKTANCVLVLEADCTWITKLVYSPEGDQIAAGSGDNTARIWDIESAKCLLAIKGFTDKIAGISWKSTADQQYIVTGSLDNSVRHWQIIKEGDGYKALLRWSSSHGSLTVPDASFKNVQGLSAVNWKILCQRGALKA